MRGKRAKLIRKMAVSNREMNTYVWEIYHRSHSALGYDDATIMRKFYRRAKAMYKAWRQGRDTVV